MSGKKLSENNQRDVRCYRWIFGGETTLTYAHSICTSWVQSTVSDDEFATHTLLICLITYNLTSLL